ncbi:MAG: hypothetical protein ACXWQX_10640 [Bdellovibrio sp.]
MNALIFKKDRQIETYISNKSEKFVIVDTYGYIIDGSQEIEKLYEYERLDFIGMSFSHLYKDFDKVVDGFQFFKAALIYGSYENECKMLKKNGFFNSKNSISPLYNSTNDHVGFVIKISVLNQ